MGNISALVTRPNDERIAEKTHPSKADWITAHAAGTGLSVLEVEKLWLRFRQLGCNKDGVITDTVIKSKDTVAGQDAFMRIMLIKLKSSNTVDGVVYFQTFLNAMSWMEMTNQEEKLRACFGLMNNGNPWNRKVFLQVISKVFPTDTQQGAARLTESVFNEISTDGQEITERAFIAYCQKNFPVSVLEGLLRFSIIPESVTLAAHIEMEHLERQVTPQPKKAKTPVKLNVEASYTIPTDSQLNTVASLVSRRDYRLLGNKLGFFESDMNHIESLYPGDRQKQVFYLLKEWRKREGSKAYVITLQKCLQEARFESVALELQAVTK